MNDLNKDIIRAVLAGPAKLAYDKMAEVLKTEFEYIKVTPSKLISSIIRRFADTYFEKDKVMLAGEFFDSKEHLKETLKTAQTPEAIEKALTDALERLKNGMGEVLPPRKQRGRKPKGPVSDPAGEGSIEEQETSALGSVS